MFTDEIRDYLRQPLIARLATFGTDGYPHNVPLWFMLEGDDILITSVRKTQKVENLRANPRAALTVGGDVNADGSLTPGYLLRGEITIEEDPGYEFLRRVTYHYEAPEQAAKDYAEWSTTLDSVTLRMKVISIRKVA